MELQGCWATVDHDVEVEATGIHDGEDDCSGGEEKTMLKMLKKLVFCSLCTLLSCSLMTKIHLYL
jgi:hypothetical protein